MEHCLQSVTIISVHSDVTFIYLNDVFSNTLHVHPRKYHAIAGDLDKKMLATVSIFLIPYLFDILKI